MRNLRFLLLILTVISSAQSINDTIQLKDMVFNPNEKQRSLDIMKNVGKNVKKNYQFYKKVNYPITIEYEGITCRENYKGEIAYATLLNSSFILDNKIDNESCMMKDNGNSYPLSYVLSANIRWLDNWGGAFSTKRIKKAKYGKLATIGDIHLISIQGKDSVGAEIEVNKNDFAILRLQSSNTYNPSNEADDNMITKGLGNHSFDIKFEKYNGKYHPERIIVRLENNKNVNIIFGKAKPYKKLKEEKGGKNLFYLIVQPKKQD